MNKRIRVGVIMGGATAEHEVSRDAGSSVLDALSKDKYDVLPVVISRGGDWSIDISDLQSAIDIAYLSLRGRHSGGETIQSVLKDNNIPYTGSDVLPSALAMNKVMANRVFEANGFNVPKFMLISRHDWKSADLDGFDYPLIIKPVDQGSSLGVSVARNDEELNDSLMNAFQFSKDAMIQEFIPGHEVACSIIDDGAGDIVPLPVTEVIPGGGIFSYERKNASNVKHYRTPAGLTDHGTEYIQETAAHIHNLIGASGMSRTDMIIAEDDTLYVLEINTVPYINESSLLVSASDSHGLTRGELLDRILEAGLRKHGLLLSHL